MSAPDEVELPGLSPAAIDRPEAPGFPRLTEPYPPQNPNPQLSFEGFLPRLYAGIQALHRDMQAAHQVDFDQALVLQCLVHVLLTKGLVRKEELDAVYPQNAKALEETRAQLLTGPRTAVPPPDIQAPKDLDCSAHYPQCEAACCTSFNVFLTAEEAASNKYLWDLAMPYRLLVDDDGMCVYFDAVNFKCTIWKDRPASCRNFDCRTDGRVWEDYEGRRVSLMMMESKARQAAARQKARAGT